MQRVCFLLMAFVLIASNPLWANENWRIVSLKPNVTDLLFELGLGDRVVGITTFCEVPDKYRSIDRVADYMHVNVEKVLLEKPTHILGSQENSQKREVELLKQQGLKVYLFSFNRLQDIEHSTLALGRLFHKEEGALNLVNRLNRSLVVSNQGVKKKSVFMVVGIRPLIVVGGNNLYNDLIEKLGMHNLAGESSLRYPHLSLERFMMSQPEIIIDLTMEADRRNEVLNEFYQKWQSIPAVREKQIYYLDIADFRPSQRLLRGIQELKEISMQSTEQHVSHQ